MSAKKTQRSAAEGASPAEPKRLSLPLRFYSGLRSTLLNLGALVGIVSLLVVAAGFFFSVAPLNVISGSMEPGIPTGSMIFSRTVPAAEITEGDVITVNRVGSTSLVTHRVVSIKDLGDGTFEAVLKGDANEQNDPESYVIKQARSYMFQVNGLGTISEFLGRPFGISLLVLAGAILVFVFLFPAGSFAREAEGDSEPTTSKSGR